MIVVNITIQRQMFTMSIVYRTPCIFFPCVFSKQLNVFCVETGLFLVEINDTKNNRKYFLSIIIVIDSTRGFLTNDSV